MHMNTTCGLDRMRLPEYVESYLPPAARLATQSIESDKKNCSCGWSLLGRLKIENGLDVSVAASSQFTRLASYFLPRIVLAPHFYSPFH